MQLPAAYPRDRIAFCCLRRSCESATIFATRGRTCEGVDSPHRPIYPALNSPAWFPESHQTPELSSPGSVAPLKRGLAGLPTPRPASPSASVPEQPPCAPRLLREGRWARARGAGSTAPLTCRGGHQDRPEAQQAPDPEREPPPHGSAPPGTHPAQGKRAPLSRSGAAAGLGCPRGGRGSPRAAGLARLPAAALAQLSASAPSSPTLQRRGRAARLGAAGAGKPPPPRNLLQLSRPGPLSAGWSLPCPPLPSSLELKETPTCLGWRPGTGRSWRQPGEGAASGRGTGGKRLDGFGCQTAAARLGFCPLSPRVGKGFPPRNFAGQLSVRTRGATGSILRFLL